MVLKEGTRLQNGKYEILRVLGQGGFGITYEAVHVLLGKKVALKEFYMKDVCLRDVNSNLVSVPSLGSGALVEKFKNKFIKEARTIVSLEHPHIVKIHDVFEENGTAYYVMDLLPGGSLAEKVKKEGPLSENVAISYLRQIADALSYIHAHNTVHLDIKPSNILLDANNNAVLIDFGLSKHYDDSGDQTSTTPVGISKGYAPLEQYRDGDISQFKPSTDIYAIGATLYFLVTGTVPPEASVVNEDGLERVSTVSETVWEAIVSAMQPKRKERPQTVNDFLKCFAVSKIEHRTLVSNDVESEDTQIITNEVGVLNGYDWVDLGLPSGTRWATRNIGANSPEEYGDYYAWGETKIKDRYIWKSYIYQESNWNGQLSKLKKYNYTREFGDTDFLSELEQEDDVASNLLGIDWHIPTDRQWTELRKYCIWEWVIQGKSSGFLVRSKKNNNSIFLPAAGLMGDKFKCGYGAGYYWSSSLYSTISSYAWASLFDSSGVRNDSFCSRYLGFSIRPVLG